MDIDELINRATALQENSKKNIRDLNMIADESHRVYTVAANSEAILEEIDEKFEKYSGLTKLDVSFLFLAVALQIVRQYFVTNFQERIDDQKAAKNTSGHTEEYSNRKHRYYNPSLEEILTNPVPFDANIGANGALTGGKTMGHRVTALGHDPILGLFVGTSNIATSTLTNKDFKSYHIYTNANDRDYFRNNANTALVFSKTKDKLFNQGIEGKKIVGTSLIKEIIHLRSDLNTKNSLPLPIISTIDSGLAADLAKSGLDMSNVVTVGKQVGYSILINTLIYMIHGLFYDESVEYSREIYEVRTRKILSYSNVIASTSNLIYVGLNMSVGNEGALKNLDLGGLMVTLYRVVTDAEFIRKIKAEFIENEFFSMIKGSEYDFT